MRYTCTVCNRELVTRRAELSWSELAAGTRPVPYHACLREADTAPAYACAQCIEDHDAPGKFEALRHDRRALGVALILNAWSLDGAEDDRMYSEGWGSCERLGRFLLMTDSSGFVTIEEHDTDAKAEEEFTRYYVQGWGASEDDAYISDDRDGYAVSFEGRHLGTFERETRARAAISLEMRRTGYYPDVWHVNERGSIDHIGGRVW